MPTRRLATGAAERAPGVLAIVSHLSSTKVPGYQTAETNHNPRVEGRGPGPGRFGGARCLHGPETPAAGQGPANAQVGPQQGESGRISFAAAVANAVYHATGRRIRELPITPDKLVEEKGGGNHS